MPVSISSQSLGFLAHRTSLGSVPSYEGREPLGSNAAFASADPRDASLSAGRPGDGQRGPGLNLTERGKLTCP